LIPLSSLDIEQIATSHGVIWRKYIPEILTKYKKWANYENDNKALIIYDTMWGSTEALANEIKSTFEDNNIPVMLRSLKHSHISDVITDVLESRYVMIGSPTLNNGILPTIGAFLTYAKGLRPQNKIGFAFGSYGWSKLAIKEVQTFMQSLKWDVPFEAFNINYKPTKEDFMAIREIITKLCGGNKNVK
jgi:flavorubredoxin